MRRDNRGLSLVEIIIVVAILSIVAGAVTMGVSLATGRPADECAAKLQSILQSSRLTGMGKLSTKVEIYMNDAGYIYVRETVETATSSGSDVRTTETRIGETGITFEYTLTNGSTGTLTPGGAPLILSFDRSSGKFKDLSPMGSGYVGVYCQKITITRGNRVKLLTLATLTGKVTLE